MPSNIHAAIGKSFPHIRHTSLELVLLPHRGLGFLSLWELSIVTICLKAFLFVLQLYNQKSQKHLHLLLLYLSSFLTNTFSSSWVRQPFLIERCYSWSPALGSHQLPTLSSAKWMALLRSINFTRASFSFAGGFSIPCGWVRSEFWRPKWFRPRWRQYCLHLVARRWRSRTRSCFAGQCEML